MILWIFAVLILFKGKKAELDHLINASFVHLLLLLRHDVYSAVRLDLINQSESTPLTFLHPYCICTDYFFQFGQNLKLETYRSIYRVIESLQQTFNTVHWNVTAVPQFLNFTTSVLQRLKETTTDFFGTLYSKLCPLHGICSEIKGVTCKFQGTGWAMGSHPSAQTHHLTSSSQITHISRGLQHTAQSVLLGVGCWTPGQCVLRSDASVLWVWPCRQAMHTHMHTCDAQYGKKTDFLPSLPSVFTIASTLSCMIDINVLKLDLELSMDSEEDTVSLNWV